ncbi:MAG TPA: flagellar hook-basal body complex protein [Candidatus Aquilonibacter sp.]|nr:flagellar hook-basal body complex protein [Candidatus Aquilonibacter sp.]
MAFDSLNIGITGLNAYQSWIDMLSNNIANTATVGFKGQRMTFADQFYQQVQSGTGPSQTRGGTDPQDFGLGVKVNTVDTQFAQGGLETTGINTDLAINGDGFFILRNADGSSTPTYTRDGAFSLNANGLLYDPASGLAVQGYTANSSGQISQTGSPADINIPIGLTEQATATGQGVKVGPNTSDQVFDMSMGGNLDQTQWQQQFLNSVGASPTPGTTKTISTTLYDSLGNAHQATITYTPDVTGATAATGSVATNSAVSGGGNLINAFTVPPGATYNVASPATIGVSVVNNGGVIQAKITDGTNTTYGSANSTVSFDGISFQVGNIAAADVGTATGSMNVTKANNALPSAVDNAAGTKVTPATRWKVDVSFTDGTQFTAISTPASISAGGAVTAPTTTNVSSGTLGYLYFDQNGQFINSSSIVSDASGNGIIANAAGFIHSTSNQPSIDQGNQLNVTVWGTGAGNVASSGATPPTTGPIGLDFSNQASLAGTYTANVISQNGYSAGTLSSISVGQDGSITGSFTNGQNKTLAQIALATFQNEQGLQRVGSNQFAATAASGLAQLGTGASGRYGDVVSGSLEQSNVNLADQFTKLIVAQRAFEANSRGITTADQNLITLVNLRASEN